MYFIIVSMKEHNSGFFNKSFTRLLLILGYSNIASTLKEHVKTCLGECGSFSVSEY